jgi:hypothetical protein
MSGEDSVRLGRFRDLVIDSWSWLNFKPIYSDPMLGMPNRRAFAEAQMTWVPDEDRRRLAAYKLMAAYDSNQAGELAAFRDGPEASERREYGDVGMFHDALVSHVLGQDQRIVVDGAEADVPGQEDAAAIQAQAVQDRLRDWADSELFTMRLQQAERKAVPMGDAVYRLAWDPGKSRVTLRVTDAGFYFPVIGEDSDDGEYPTRVHFAWELPEDTRRGLKPRLRRITYELDWIYPATVSSTDELSRPVRVPIIDDTGAVHLGQGNMLDPVSGAIYRQYAWNDHPSYVTCYLTDAIWLLEDLRSGHDVDSLPMDKATYAVRSDGEVLNQLDLLIDFIPVVHQPNTVPPAEEHWGQPSIAKVLQVMDELAGSDTDAAHASATTGMPIIALSGLQGDRQEAEARAGMVFKLEMGGRMDVLDTAPQLAELRNTVESLRDRASTNVRLPAVALGTNDPSKLPSGYALKLSLGPMDMLISGMRLARAHKESLLLKMVQRLHIAGQHPDWIGTPVLHASVIRGAYTPTDRAGVLEEVATAYEAGLLSLETALRMLIEAGFPITDAAEEIKLIQQRQFTAAAKLADATGSQPAVHDFLGLKRVVPTDPPAPLLPGGPGADPTAVDAGQERP